MTGSRVRSGSRAVPRASQVAASRLPRVAVTAANLNLGTVHSARCDCAEQRLRFGRCLVRLNTALKKFGDKANNFFTGINTLAEQDGIFDQLSATIDARLAQMQTGLALAQSGLRRVARGGVARLVRRPALSVTRSDQRDLAVSAANVAALDKERRDMADELKKVNKQLADAKKGTKAIPICSAHATSSWLISTPPIRRSPRPALTVHQTADAVPAADHQCAAPSDDRCCEGGCA